MMESLEHHVSYLSKYGLSMFQDSSDIRDVGLTHILECLCYEMRLKRW